jgi:aarF domain-containing kinase
MKTSTFARTVELARLAASLGLKEMRSGNLKSRVEQATLIAKSLSNLKGAAMKAGQLLSLDLDHYFPPEAIEILSQLQNAATAQPFDVMEAALKRELSAEQLKSISNIDPTPIGVASIGQVHRARIQGAGPKSTNDSTKDIVLKIQFPGVEDSIEADLKILKTIAVSFCQLTGRQMDLGPLFAEFKRILEQEVNYEKEAHFQNQYASFVLGLEENRKSTSGFSLQVPALESELCAKKVIAMEFKKGVPLRNWIASQPPLEKRKMLATAILDLYFHEFFEWGFVQTDPNWANFLIDESSSTPKLIILDFGAVRQYPREFIQNYIQLLEFASQGDSARLKKHAIDFGLIDARESASAFTAFEEVIKTAIRPFFVNDGESSIFDFSNQQHVINSNNASKVLSAELIYSPPPYNLVFLHRKLAGVYSILKSLEVKLDISGYWQKMRDLSAHKPISQQPLTKDDRHEKQN